MFLDTSRALDQFLATVERRAFRMAQLATGDAEVALDLVQDAMLDLVQRYAGRSEAEWGPLFHRILQNRIRDWYRRQKVRRRWQGWFGGPDMVGAGGSSAGDPIQAAPDPKGVSPADQVSHSDAMDALEIAMKNLPQRQQQAFLLRLWEGLDVAQTAQAMGCSPGSVKTHYSRALQNLRLQLKDYYD